MQSIQIPPLDEGEIYVGCIGNAAGELYRVVLLPGDNDDADQEKQLEWAQSIGGDLPNRIEQAMLWSNHRDQFKQDWYWSNEKYHNNSNYAWVQFFYNGNQDTSFTGSVCRARAVRRVPV